ncbi:MAG: hypothetical protein HUU37_10190, partial [Bdellovibrionales bacterium]|nr:hypothetical protein [Bdellovibrionales bacterium]
MRWKIAGMAGALLLTACAPGGSVTTNTNATAGSGESSLTDVKRIVSTGVGINFNALVGTYSQMAVHPTTKLPVVVYYDRSTVMGNGATAAGALKYAYMNAAGDWTIEVVDVNTGTAACGAAASYCVGAQNIAAPAHASGLPQVLDVKFTAGVNGGSVKPIIAYVFGNNAATGKRIRVAERNSSTGLWAISDAVPTTGIPAGIAVATL